MNMHGPSTSALSPSMVAIGPTQNTTVNVGNADDLARGQVITVRHVVTVFVLDEVAYHFARGRLVQNFSPS